MKDRWARILLLASLATLLVFVVNVFFGASGRGALFSDVGEFLVLFASCIFFVAATLRLERQEKLLKQSRPTADAE